MKNIHRAEEEIAGLLNSDIMPKIGKLQRVCSKALDDLVIIAAELGSKADYQSVIARIRQLRELERKYTVPAAEKKASDEMVTRTEYAFTEAPAPEQVEAEERAMAAYVAAHPEIVQVHGAVSADTPSAAVQ